MASFKAKMKKKLPSVGKDMDLHTLLVEGVTPDSYFRKILRSSLLKLNISISQDPGTSHYILFGFYNLLFSSTTSA